MITLLAKGKIPSEMVPAFFVVCIIITAICLGPEIYKSWRDR